MRAAAFPILFVLVLAFTTVTHDHGGLGFGTHSFSSYGWPQRWLTVDHIRQTIVIHPDGTRMGGERSTKWKVDWQGFIVSGGAAAGIAALLCLPFFLGLPGAKHLDTYEERH